MACMACMEKALSAARWDKVWDQRAFTGHGIFVSSRGYLSGTLGFQSGVLLYFGLFDLAYSCSAMEIFLSSPHPFQGWQLHYDRIASYPGLPCGKSNKVTKQTLFSTFALQSPH